MLKCQKQYDTTKPSEFKFPVYLVEQTMFTLPRHLEGMVWPTFVVVVVVLLSYCQCEAETKISYLTISRYTSAIKVYFFPLFLSLARLVAILFLIFLFLWCPFLFVGTTSWTLAEHCIYNPRQSPRTKFSGQNRVLFWYCKSLDLIGKNEFLFEVVYLPRPGICIVSQSNMLARRSSTCRKCTNVCDKYLSEKLEIVRLFPTKGKW